MAELPFWLLKSWSKRYCVKNAQMKTTAFESPFSSGKIVNQKQYHICGEIAEVIIPIEVFRDASMLIFNISPFKLNSWLMRSPSLKVNISRSSEI